MKKVKKILNWWQGGIVYNSSYQALLTAAGANAPSNAALKAAQNTLMAGLITDGLLSKLDILYIFFGGNLNNHIFAGLNWVNPSTFALTEMNSPTFGAYGFTGNGSNMYLKTGWIPNSNGVQYTQNDASLIAHQIGSGVTSTILVGADDAGDTKRLTFEGNFTGSLLLYEVNTDTISSLATKDGSGVFQTKRTGASANSIFRGGTSLATDTKTSTGRTAKELYILASNENGTANFFSTNTIGCLAAGASFSAADSLNFAARYSTYCDAIGQINATAFPVYTSDKTFTNFKTAFDSLQPYEWQPEDFSTVGNAAIIAKYPASSTLYEGVIISSYNGKIYGSPHNADSIMEVDPGNSDAIRFIGTLDGSNCGATTNRYVGIWEDVATKILYFNPGKATKIMYYNPMTDTIGFVPTANGPTVDLSDNTIIKFAGCCTVANGDFVGAPFSFGAVLLIHPASDPATTTYEKFGTVSGTNQYVGCCVIDDGITVYFAPYNAAKAGKANTSTKSFSVVGTDYSADGSTKSSGAIFVPSSKKVYFTPFNSVSIYKLDPTADTTSTITHGLSGSFESSHLMPDGNIVLCPNTASTVAIINTTRGVADTVRTWGGTITGGSNGKTCGFAMTAKGVLYGLPMDSAYGFVTKISASSNLNLSSNEIYSLYMNHY